MFCRRSWKTALEEYISVFEQAIQRSTKAHHCQLRTTRRIRLVPSWPRASLTSGRRLMARERSASEKYLAFVLVGVSGKHRKP